MSETSHFFFYIDFGRNVNGIIIGQRCRFTYNYKMDVYIHDPYKLKNGPGPPHFLTISKFLRPNTNFAHS